MVGKREMKDINKILNSKYLITNKINLSNFIYILLEIKTKYYKLNYLLSIYYSNSFCNSSISFFAPRLTFFGTSTITFT